MVGRTFKRLPIGDRSSAALLDEVRGSPWKPVPSDRAIEDAPKAGQPHGEIRASGGGIMVDLVGCAIEAMGHIVKKRPHTLTCSVSTLLTNVFDV